ncbi:MAG TPA: NUDIX hydrolase [Egibacteraceae bacterium]|nr:NUDIX hydrolase [Egibacteraceae bacterium]
MTSNHAAPEHGTSAFLAAELVALAVERLSGLESLVTPAASTAEALQSAGLPVRRAALDGLSEASVDGVVLLADEVSRSGEHAEGLLVEAARVLSGGGLVLVGACSAVYAAATDSARRDLRTYSADDLGRMLGHRGFAVELLCAPGAARRLAGSPVAYDPQLDRVPGLLGAAPRVTALGRLHPDRAGRSGAFFASLPRKVVAAATLCRDAEGRLLVVHDTFKGHWTIPGGVVDADEDPRAGAERETWEEAGARVRAGRLLGLFAHSWPDRLLLVYEAEPVGDTSRPLAPVHGHEIGAAQWLPLDEALDRLNPRTAQQVTRCLDSPGGTWRQP